MTYKKPSVTVDIGICTIIDNDLKVLLISRKHGPFKAHWALPGGFLEVGYNWALPGGILKAGLEESLEEAAYRELREETSLDHPTAFLEQLKTYGDPDRDPRGRVITVVYYALLPYSKKLIESVQAQDDACETLWFSLKSLPPNLAFDHKVILMDLLERIQGKISYSPIVFGLLPEWFTWAQLQGTYEMILGKKLYPKNFRKKICSQYKLKIRQSRKKGYGRPPVYLKYIG